MPQLDMQHRFSTDEFLALEPLPERVELIDGVICDMSPEGPKHAMAQKEVERALEGSLSGWHVLLGGSLYVTDDFCPIPDVVVYDQGVNLELPAFQAQDARLVVEIGVSTSRLDRVLKLPAYAAGEIDEVWLVAPDAGMLTCCRHPADGGYAEIEELAWPDGLDAAVEQLAQRLDT